MKRIIFDTNIYGLMLEKQEKDYFKTIITQLGIIVYGCSIVKKELRAVPKKIRTPITKNLRIDLLRFYDEITQEHQLAITCEMEEIAEEYKKFYSHFGGSLSHEHLHNDFLIVACASVNNLDLVISDDHKSLFSMPAIRAYAMVHTLRNIRPILITAYEDFKTVLKRWSL